MNPRLAASCCVDPFGVFICPVLLSNNNNNNNNNKTLLKLKIKYKFKITIVKKDFSGDLVVFNRANVNNCL